MAQHTFTAERTTGDRCLVGGDIVGFITCVKFLHGRDTPLYSVEWFHNGSLQNGDFYAEQLEDYDND